MKNTNEKKNNKKACLPSRNVESSRGFVILFAVTLSSIILAISLGIANIAFKEVRFSTSAKDTNEAFYAADTGAEAVLLMDKNPLTFQFPASSSTVWPFTIPGLGSSGSGCAKVTIEKFSTTLKTRIISKGYNLGGDGSCNSLSTNLVEREIQVDY